MFNKSIKLFEILGFTVKIDLSWLIIVTLVVWSLGGAVFPQLYPDLATSTHWIMGAVAALGLFASIVVHELSHSLVARRFGLPMKGITLFLFGGVAEMNDQPPSPKAEGLMAIAGPAVSVVVAVVFLLLAALGASQGWPTATVGVLRWIGFINGVLVAFNLIPGFPLDGGRVLRAVLWHIKGDLRKATHTASKVGSGFGLVLVGLGILNLLSLNPIGGLWWILIGLFVRSAAKQGYQQVIIRQMLRGETVDRFMNDHPVTVPPETTVEHLVDDYVYHHHYKTYPVVDRAGQLEGCVSTRQVKEIDRDQWKDTRVDEIVENCSQENTVSPNTDAMDALMRMSRSGNSRLMVAEGGQLRGILSLKDLLGFLSMKVELESDQPPQELPSPEQMAGSLPTTRS